MKKILTLILVIISISCFTQNNHATIQALLANDNSNIHLLFTYPDTIRTTIFTAATYPQGFTRLDEIQKQSAASFKKAVSSYSKKKQEKLWDLARFPSIFPLLISNKDKSKDELKTILADYPEDIRKNGIYFAKHNYNTLVEIEKIHQDFESQYKSTINQFPGNVQSSFRRLLLHPELLSILNHNINTTITLGDIYQQDPALLKHVADSVSNEIAKQDGVAYEEWKKGIYEDEKVQKGLKKASEKHTEKHRSSDDIYQDHQSSEAVDASASDHNSTPPYPYWSGYPYWYDTPYWYPYPWWVQSGYYWNPYTGITVYGMPGYYFGSWYYNYPYYYRYPHATRRFKNHYQNRPRNNGGSYYNNRERGSNQPSGGGTRGGGGRSGGRRR